MYDHYIGFPREEKKIELTTQKIYLYCDKNGDVGTTIFKRDELIINNVSRDDFFLDSITLIKKNSLTIEQTINKTIEDCKFPLQIFITSEPKTQEVILKVLDFSSSKIDYDRLEISVNDSTSEDFKAFLERCNDLRTSIIINPSSVKYKDKSLENDLVLALNKIPLSAKGISFLIAFDNINAPNIQEIADIYAKYSKAGLNNPLGEEIALQDVLKEFDR